MSDLHDELDRESRRFPEPDPNSMEQVVRRARRQQRVRKLTAVGVALVISVTSSFVLVRAFHKAAPGPITHSATPTAPPTATGTPAPSPSPKQSPTPVPVRHFLSAGEIDLLSPTFAVAVVQHCVAKGDYGPCTNELVSSRDFGATWQVLIPAAVPDLKTLDSPSMEQVLFSDPQHGWVVTKDCAMGRLWVMRTSDGGSTWRRTNGPDASCAAGAGVWVDFINPSTGWRTHLEPTGPGADLYSTSDGGATWRRVVGGLFGGLPTIGRPGFIDSSHWWITGVRGSYRMILFRTVDAGAHWTRVPLPLPTCCRSRFVGEGVPPVFFGSTGVLVEHDRKATSVYTSSDGGSTWREPVMIPAAGVVSVVSASVWWFDGNQGIQITTDGGRTWKTRTAPPGGPKTWTSWFTALDATHAWAVVNDAHNVGTLYTTTDGGRTWNKVTWKGAA